MSRSPRPVVTGDWQSTGRRQPTSRFRSLLPAAFLFLLLAPLSWLGDLRIAYVPYLVLVTASTLLLYTSGYLFERWGIDVPKGRLIAVALVLRLAMLPMLPSLSDDAWRYLWDGRLVAHGINPYLPVPADPALSRFHDGLFQLQGYPTTNTIYPPGAQILFATCMAIGEGVTGDFLLGYLLYKLLLIAAEMIAIWILLRLMEKLKIPLRHALLYAWHPLVIVELAGQGHTDAFWTLSLALALAGYASTTMENGRGGGLAGLALGGVIRLYPLALFPLWLRYLRSTWRGNARWGGALLPTLLLLLPFLLFLDPATRASFLTVLGRFTNYYEFNGGFYYGVKWIADELHLQPSNRIAGAIGTGMQMLVHLLVWLWPVRDGSTISLGRRALLLVTAEIVLGAKVHIWYFAAPLLLLSIVPHKGLRWGWLWTSLVAPFTYLMYVSQSGHERMEIVALEWGGFLLLAIVGGILDGRKRQPPALVDESGRREVYDL